MIGFGYDIHRLSEGESMILGGIKIESNIGTIAHSDGDVLIHALIDALLGAAALGDIGEFFPDTDPKYKNISSVDLLQETLSILKNADFVLGNIDATIILQEIKLKNYKPLIKKNLADICCIPLEKVNIKAKTNEHIGCIGRSEGVGAMVAIELFKKD